jgi:hypothetical protein
MRLFNNLARDRTQNRCPLLLIARLPARQAIWVTRRGEDGGARFGDFTRQQGAVTDTIEIEGRQTFKI